MLELLLSSLCWLFCFASKNHLICACQTNQFCGWGGWICEYGPAHERVQWASESKHKKGLSLNSRSLEPNFIFDDTAEVRKVVRCLKSMGEDHVGCFCHMKILPSLIMNFAENQTQNRSCQNFLYWALWLWKIILSL